MVPNATRPARPLRRVVENVRLFNDPLRATLLRSPRTEGVGGLSCFHNNGLTAGVFGFSGLSPSSGFRSADFAANLIAGPAATPASAVIGGAITGVVLGAVQWFVLAPRLGITPLWVVATGIGLAIGLGLGVAVAGSENADNAFLWRALVGGICVGVAQAFLLRGVVAQPVLWAGVVFVAWLVGWYVTRGIGVDLTHKWTVFGAAGAITFQVITGAALYLLTKRPQPH